MRVKFEKQDKLINNFDEDFKKLTMIKIAQTSNVLSDLLNVETFQSKKEHFCSK
jgi:hypothetical protein